MQNSHNPKIMAVGFLFLVPILFVNPCYSNESKPSGEPGAPPKEAFAACEGKTAGDIVPFTGRQGEVLQATCKDINGRLVAVPPGGPDRGPSLQR